MTWTKVRLTLHDAREGLGVVVRADEEKEDGAGAWNSKAPADTCESHGR
jgi:hypothetical protein